MDKEAIIKLILDNEIIKKIIKDYNLNQDQIESGYVVFLKIIEESQNLEQLEYITWIKILDEKNIIPIFVNNKNRSMDIKRKQHLLFSNISNVDENIVFDKPNKSGNIKNLKSNLFFWDFSDIENKRVALAGWFKEFYKNLTNKKYTKGFYLHGNFGLGKTYFSFAFINYLLNKEIYCCFLNTSDFYEFLIKNLDKNSDMNFFVIDKIKNVSILVFDDLGGEKTNSWYLFNILYPILEYREKHKKTTCFTSVLSLNNLKKYWAKNKEIDYLKLERLVNKIKNLSIQIELKGDDLREK